MIKDVQHRMELMRDRADGYKKLTSKEEAFQVLFASETGTAESLARDFSDACTKSHSADSLNDMEPEDLDGKTNIFFVSTTGQGAMPQNGIEFFKLLCSRIEPFPLGTQYTIMGLGDSSYYHYLKAAKDIDYQMQRLGAKCISPMGLGDDSDEGGYEDGLQLWVEAIWPALGLNAPTEVPYISPVDCNFSKRAILPEYEDNQIVGQYHNLIGLTSVTILKKKLLSEEGHNRDFYSFTLDSKELAYEPGDTLEILPCNDYERVVSFLDEYTDDMDERTVIKLNHVFGISGEISLGALFTNILDIFGKPTKHFLQQLATFEDDIETRQNMLDVNTLKKMSSESGATFADVLLRFRSARIPLPALLSMVPPIKVRGYSIASTPSVSPNNIELCVLIDTFWVDEGIRYGLTCDMLRKLHIGENICCRVKQGHMEPPFHHQPGKCLE